MPTPQQLREQGNRLAQARSLYLRQHGHNPVDWYPWGEEALRRAREEDRPIFLSVGYSACHWCHVMEREVFEQDEVAALLNEHFVAIKVDREERPDLDAVYMEALQALSGGGGWPMSLFLTPDLRPFHGETYVPRDRFVLLAGQLLQIYRDNREQVEAQARLLRRRVATAPELSPEASLGRELLAGAAHQATRYFDERYGGFRGPMRFPTPARWSFLLHHYARTGDETYGQMVRTTLDAMAGGGICDQLAGGFHRYAVEPSWTVPHFEKMLYDNAQLAALYAEAAVILEEPRYAGVARTTLDFVLREMQQPEGGFYASFDADADGVEGASYVWTPAEIEAVAGPEEAHLLCRLLGVSEEGNFEGKNVLTDRADLAALAAQSGQSEGTLRGLLDRHRDALLAARAERPAPTLDQKVVTGWNGLCLIALARSWALLGEARHGDAAVRAGERLWAVHRDGEGGLFRVANGDRAEHPAVLSDYAFVMLGFVELFLAGGGARWLRRALKLLDVVQRRFVHPEAGFFATAEGTEAPMGRQMEYLDSVRPSAGAAMARTLVLVSALRGDPELAKQAERSIAAFAPWIKRFGLEMAAWLDATDLLLGPLYEVVVAGDPEDPATEALLRAARQTAPHHALTVALPAEGPDEATERLCPITSGKTAQNGRPTAYACTGGTCRCPTSDPEELKRQLQP